MAKIPSTPNTAHENLLNHISATQIKLYTQIFTEPTCSTEQWRDQEMYLVPRDQDANSTDRSVFTATAQESGRCPPTWRLWIPCARATGLFCARYPHRKVPVLLYDS